MVNGLGFAPLGLLLVGLLVGWMAGRTVPWPENSPAKVEAEGETAACAMPNPPAAADPETNQPVAAKTTPVAVANTPSELIARLGNLKISELRKICEDAENQFLTQKISGHATAIEDLSKNERDQELALLRRQFLTAIEQSPYWRMDFSIESGADVLYGEIVLDLEGNSDVDFKCVSWSFYYELNGQVQRSSLFGASACEGSGIRKRNSAYYLDIATYNFTEIGKFVADILIPVPPSTDAIEILRADTENWQALGGRPWTRITRADFMAWQRKIGEKTGANP